MPKQNDDKQNKGLKKTGSAIGFWSGLFKRASEINKDETEKDLLENNFKNTATESVPAKADSLKSDVLKNPTEKILENKKKEASSQEEKKDSKKSASGLLGFFGFGQSDKKEAVELPLKDKKDDSKTEELKSILGETVKKEEVIGSQPVVSEAKVEQQKIDTSVKQNTLSNIKETDSLLSKKSLFGSSKEAESKDSKPKTKSFWSFLQKKPTGTKKVELKESEQKSSVNEMIKKEEKIPSSSTIPETNLTKKNEAEITNLNDTQEEKPLTPKNILSGLFKREEKSEEEKQPQGKKNLFADLFPQEVEKSEDDSLIETIVEQSNQTKTQSILGQKLHNRKQETLEEKVEEKVEKSDLLFWSQITLAVSFFIPLIVSVFFYYQVVPQSSLLNFFGIENTGMLHEQKQAERDDLNSQITTIKKNIAQMEATSKENQLEKLIKQIQAVTNDWLIVMDNIKEVTNEGVHYNDLLKRVVYNSYNFNSKDNAITLNAKIFDPNKQVFTLATSLIDAVNDSEYFEGMENRNFSKSISEDGAEMSLAMSFNYIPESERNNLTTVLEK